MIAGEESDDAAVSEDEEDTDEDEEINLGELERTLSNDEGMELLIFIYTLKSMPVTVSSADYGIIMSRTLMSCITVIHDF